MATRNRTLLFRKHRDALKSVRIPSFSSAPSTASGAGGGPVIELATTSFLNSNRSYTPISTDDPGNSSRGPNAITVGLPPVWVDLSEEIAANVQRARTKMGELAKAHSKALMPSFGDGKEDQRAIETLTHEITDLIKKSEKRLRRLSATGPSEDSNVRKNVQVRLLNSHDADEMDDEFFLFPHNNRSLATDLQNLSVELRKKQSTYLKRLRQQKEGQDGVDLEMLNGSKSKYEDDDLDNMVFNEHQMAKLKKSEAFTIEREKEIQQVVESVNELAQIMKDLSVLVIDQGTIVDRIDYNIQNVATTVEDGLKQLQKAERTQKKGGMVMCATVLLIMCFVMLVLLIIKEIIL
ncbi:Syntaxin-43 [Glycine soja]